MAAAIKGKQISWGVSAAGITLANAATTAGIVESITIERGGETSKIVDEDGDIVTRIDHGEEIKLEIEVKALLTSTVPAKGTEITGLAAIDLIPINTGRTFVESAKVTYSGSDAKKISISAVNYPVMAANA